ncbi:MAG TPA: DUF6398 domain-containing protein [Phycisphaerae bacterium]|nr:DUF6398 domain-containing protein [Phycisphaerae bacterium]
MDESTLPPLEECFEKVPPENHELFRRITALTDAFCERSLNREYTLLTREMAILLCSKDSPARKGKPEGWACGVVYAIGWVNFLTDPGNKPHMPAGDIAHGFGISEATMAAKFRVLRDGLELMRFDPAWTLPSQMGDNPLAWMIQVDGGMVVDARSMPREVQEKAHSAGLIPYIYADEHPEKAGPLSSDTPRLRLRQSEED